MDGFELSTTTKTGLGDRLLGLWEQTGDALLRRLAEAEGAATGLDGDAELETMPAPERLDWVSTALMNAYKNTGDSQVFALLFDLNRASFLQAIHSKIRRCGGTVDPQDVLQEVFLNIYRYPFRFQADKADAFRNWGHRIVRNTLLKSLKGQTRVTRMASLDEDVGDHEDTRTRSPFRSALEAESAGIVDAAYLIYLNLYLIHFNRLSDKERRALTLVEVEGASYKQAAAELGIRLENLKMVIFRGRRKIFRGLERTLEELNSAPQHPPVTHSTR